jgi:small-conductance mechanosensitive channel
LARDLLAVAVLGLALYLLFVVFPGRLLGRFTATEVLLLEAGGIVLVAFLVARAVTGAATTVIVRRGEFARGYAVRLFLNLLIAIAAVFALFRLAGVSAESIFLGSAFAGIILGLAAQTVLANVFAGLLLVVADPFRPGDRVSFVSSSYGILAPSYPHETMYPAYGGTIIDIGLIYTVLALDRGGVAKLPNNVVMSALVLEPRATAVHRIRMTFPLTVPVRTVEAALGDVLTSLPSPPTGSPGPRLEVTDISAATWDGVVVLWTHDPEAPEVRDRILRAVLGRLPGAGSERPRPAP